MVAVFCCKSSGRRYLGRLNLSFTVKFTGFQEVTTQVKYSGPDNYVYINSGRVYFYLVFEGYYFVPEKDDIEKFNYSLYSSEIFYREIFYYYYNRFGTSSFEELADITRKYPSTNFFNYWNKVKSNLPLMEKIALKFDEDISPFYDLISEFDKQLIFYNNIKTRNELQKYLGRYGRYNDKHFYKSDSASARNIVDNCGCCGKEMY